MKYSTRSSVVLSTLITFLAGCTQQLPGSFRFKQRFETFASQTKVNTKIDLLWVVDNSASMDVVQKRLREGFAGFASTYLKPYWDIRLAVITTDMYLANAAYYNHTDAYLNRQVLTSAYQSNYIGTLKSGGRSFFSSNSNQSTFYNLASDPTDSTGTFNASVTDPFGAGVTGVMYGYLVPIWGPNYAKLLAGYHDGPIPGLCFEALPYYYHAQSEPQCQTRNIASDSTAVAKAKCTDVNNASSSVDCVNTVRNNDIRTGKPILSTKDGTLTTAQLTDAFKINVSVGSVGGGSERGFESVSQMLYDNEGSGSASKFFREDSLRGIIFVSDEDDQSMSVASPYGYPKKSNGSTAYSQSELEPFSGYYCDLPTLNDTDNDELQGPGVSFDVSNVSSAYETNNGYCCTTGSGATGCKYQAISDVAAAADGGTCPKRKFRNDTGEYIGDSSTACPGGTTCSTYRVSLCPDKRNLAFVSTFKSELDDFFDDLDGNPAAGENRGKENYFVSAIVPKTKSTILSLQNARKTVDGNVGSVKIQATDVPARYLAMVDSVGQGSISADINESFSTVLDNIGKVIVSKKGTFPLSRKPTGTEDMTVYRVNDSLAAGMTVIKQSEADYVVECRDSSSVVVACSDASAEKYSLVFQNLEYVLSLTGDDSIAVDYQPKK